MKKQQSLRNLLLSSLPFLFPLACSAADELPEIQLTFVVPTLGDVDNFETRFQTYLPPENDRDIFENDIVKGEKFFPGLKEFSAVFPKPKTPSDFDILEEFMNLESPENQTYYGIGSWATEFQQFLDSAQAFRVLATNSTPFSSRSFWNIFSTEDTLKTFPSLSFWNIPPATLVDILDCTKTPRLTLGSNPAHDPTLTDAYTEIITKQLAIKKELFHLCLAGNPITSASLGPLSIFLKKTQSLRSLSLKGTQISIDNLQPQKHQDYWLTIANALLRSTTLKTPTANWCQFPIKKLESQDHKAHWFAFAKTLPLATMLQTLTLSWCQLSTEILILAEGLKGNRYLKFLNLSHNLITGTIFFDFAEKLLEDPCHLTNLTLAGNPLISTWGDPKTPYSGYVCLEQLMKGAPSLNSLDISQTIQIQRSFPEGLHQHLKKVGI